MSGEMWTQPMSELRLETTIDGWAPPASGAKRRWTSAKYFPARLSDLAFGRPRQGGVARDWAAERQPSRKAGGKEVRSDLSRG